MEEKNTTITRRNALLAGAGAAMSAAALALAPTTARAATLSDSKVKVTLSATSFTYSGSAKKPTVTVKYGTKKLTCGTHYKLTYSGTCKQVGYHFVNIVFIGSYSSLSTVHKSYKIIPKVTISSVTKYKSGVASIKYKILGSDYFRLPSSYTAEIYVGCQYDLVVKYRLSGTSSWSKKTYYYRSHNKIKYVYPSLKSGKKYQICAYTTATTDVGITALSKLTGTMALTTMMNSLNISSTSAWNVLTSSTTSTYTVTV